MLSFLFGNHHIGYRREREEVRDKIDVNPTEALTKLDELITFNNSRKTEFPDDETIIADDLSLNHSKVHLESFQNTSQEHQKSAAKSALNEDVD